MLELPRGTVTFLFTDIEASTRLWQEHPDSMPAAYARHDALLREACASHRGVIYKTIGDAFQVAFPTAPSAVAAAVTAQRVLGAEPWPTAEPLRVRMALHSCVAEPDLAGDYRTPGLNRLGRLLAAGHGGQVLLSQAAMELARGTLPTGVSPWDLGAHRLKDLLEPERIYHLLVPELVGDFPPLRTLDARPHNLPLQPTPLVGREREVAAVVEQLRQDSTRLVTLTGPGGTGKTRLALQAAAELVESFRDGVWFVPLAPLADPALVPAAIAGAVGVREEGAQPLANTLSAFLRDKQVLLILDNYEQLLPAAAMMVGELVGTAPELTVLVTSRVPLRLRAEREIPVPPLELPRRKPPPTSAQMGQYEAVRLFIARAQAVRADFMVTNESAPAVAEICHRLDGLPLAIELAAARIRLLPPAAMLRRLEQRLSLLTGGAHDLPARQQTLRATIGWSYDLLGPEEQALFRRLAVFAGGWTFAAAEAVAGSARSGELALDVFEGLERLAEHSLLRQEEDVEGEPRFGMLETIREYGLDQLETSGEAQEARQRHASFFLAFVEEAEPELSGPTRTVRLAALEAEHDNLRSALAWGVAQAPELSLHLAERLDLYWEGRGYLSEGRRWLERALAVAPAEATHVRAKALLNLGRFARTQGDPKAVSRLEEALAIARTLGNMEVVSRSLAGLGNVAADAGDYARASILYEEQLTLDRERGDQTGVTLGIANLGVLAAQQGDLVRASAMLEECVVHFRQQGDTWRSSFNSINLGQVALAQDRLADAARFLAEGMVGLGTKEGVLGEALASLGAVAIATGQPAKAARLFGATDAFIESIGAFLDAVLPGEIDRAVAATRTALGNEAYAAAYAAGASLPLEEAMSEALAVARAVADRPDPLD